MTLTTYFFCLAGYIFVYNLVARAAYRHKLAEDGQQDWLTGPVQEIERSMLVGAMVFDWDLRLEKYTAATRLLFYIARGLVLFLPLFMLALLAFS